MNYDLLFAFMEMIHTFLYIVYLRKGGIFMKLNPDCIRDVMLCLEEILYIDNDGNFHGTSVSNVLKSGRIRGIYHFEDVRYTLLQLHERGYIVSDLKIDVTHLTMRLNHILYITPQGYDFISGAKVPAVWKLAKETMSTAKCFSFKVIESALWAALQGHLGLVPL